MAHSYPPLLDMLEELSPVLGSLLITTTVGDPVLENLCRYVCRWNQRVDPFIRDHSRLYANGAGESLEEAVQRCWRQFKDRELEKQVRLRQRYPDEQDPGFRDYETYEWLKGDGW